MSMSDVENLHERVRQELERLGLTQAEAARRMGESDSQGVRDVCSGRKRVTAEFLTKLVAIEGDVLFILTGHRAPKAKADAATGDATLHMLQGRGIYPDGRGGGRVTLEGLALILNYCLFAKGGRPIALTEKELAKISPFSAQDERPWILQPVALVPRSGGPASHTLLIYRVKTPVTLVWQLGPFQGQIPPRIELLGHQDFPLKWRGDDEEHEDRWELDLSTDESLQKLHDGKSLRATAATVQSAYIDVALGKAFAKYRSRKASPAEAIPPPSAEHAAPTGQAPLSDKKK